MLPLLHHGNIYTKRKLWAWRDKKCIMLGSTITPLTCAGRQSTASQGRRFGPGTESCLNWNGPIAMVPLLHQGNIYTKRKLQAWRDQKCIPLVVAITPLTCTGRQSTPSRGRPFGPRTESYLNWDGPIAIVPCLYQGNIYIKRKLRAWRDQKCIPLVGAKTSLTCVGRQNTPSRGRQYRVQNGKLPKLGHTYRHGTVFSLRKYLDQKEATGMERPEMYSARRCNNPTYLRGESKYTFSREAVWAHNGKLPKLGRTYCHGNVVAPR